MVTYAFVNHGRWIVPCPSCNSAGLLRGSRFVCAECRSEYEVIAPENIIEIDEILNARPNAINRNWTPGETVEKLLQENLLHGIEV